MIRAAPLEVAYCSEEVRDRVTGYCADHRITRELHAAVELAFDVYGQIKQITARLQADPETDERRVVIDVAVTGDVDQVLQRKKEYTRRWVQLASPDARDRIRVLYHFA